MILVLLPVEPYLIHAYWDLPSRVPPAVGAHPILRFYESPGRPFDVHIDLTTSSCYVNLWSPGKLYQAELGWRSDDGAFIPVAQSNIVRTPPGHAAIAASAAPPEPEPEPELSQEKLAELFARPFNLDQPDPGGADALVCSRPPGRVGPFQLAPPNEPDLTQLSEDHFTPGISSARDPLAD